MRSLQDWMKYLEEQEQSLQNDLGQKTASDEPEQAVQVEQPIRVEPPSASGPDAASRPAAGKPDSAPHPRIPNAPAAPARAPDRGRPTDSATVRTTARPRKKIARQRPAEAAGRHEVAQGSYKPFRETREELLQRLVDPLISLEEVARILNVCPTTVRRYTNRGVLQHFRTPGNQRRFRLSEVLAFLERSEREAAD